MAIVKDKSLGGPLFGATDRAYQTPNRSGSSTPYAAVTPLYVGEIYSWKDGTGAEEKLFGAEDMLNSGWAMITPTLLPAD